MNISHKDLEIIEATNREFRIISDFLQVTVDEYFKAYEQVIDKSPENIIECVFINRLEDNVINDRISDSSSEFYVLSIFFMNLYDKNRAFKWRKYSMICSLVKQMHSSLIWTVEYLGDDRCNKCSEYCGIYYNIEEEVTNPKVPLKSCELPYGICTAVAIFHPVKDKDGLSKRHNKDYKSILKIVIDKN